LTAYSVETYTKELQALTNTNNPEILKSGFSDLFYNPIDNIRDFIGILSSEQLVFLFNLLGYVQLFLIMTTILTILIGDHLINYLKLETKYPKIAKYIKFKQTINKLYLNFYIVYFYFILILIICVNIFMFSYDYFV
jgi:hypothetical protein